MQKDIQKNSDKTMAHIGKKRNISYWRALYLHISVSLNVITQFSVQMLV